jgi:hypothetical protein
MEEATTGKLDMIHLEPSLIIPIFWETIDLRVYLLSRLFK